MKDFRVDPSPCPWCGEELDGASNPEGPQGPEPGDCTICIYCAEWCIFDERLHLRRPTPEEVAEINAIPLAMKVEAAVLELWKET